MAARRARTVLLCTLVAVIALFAAGGGYAITRVVRDPAVVPSVGPTSTPAAAAHALNVPTSASGSSTAGSASPAPGPAKDGPDPTVLARILDPALASAALGTRVKAQVVDLATGAVLYNRNGSGAARPASTAKLLTAAAVLTVHRPTDQFVTTVIAGTGADRGALYLRGGGDPTLTAAAPGRPSAYAGAARLSDLAAAVTRAGVPVTRIVVDGSAFTGPSVSPSWAPDDVPSDYASGITAVLVDGGRATPSATVRSASPDLAAGAALATLLGRPNLSIQRGQVPAGDGQVLSSVRSATVATLVSQMLTDSDNVIAEVLARQVALADGRPGSFTGAAEAIRDVLARQGIPIGTGLVDGSGLASMDRVSPAVLVALLRSVAVGALISARSVVTAMPIAGWSGTLAYRYRAGAAGSAAGDIRAKTGTLSGVSSLAGLVHSRDGRDLAFAFIADQTGPTAPAEAALDAAATVLTECGCR